MSEASGQIAARHGSPGQLTGRSGQAFIHEERALLAEVDKARYIGNSQIIGANGEKPLREFFSRYLPPLFRTVTGKFVTPSGVLSPQIDLAIMDNRYPLLSAHSDGSVLMMLHSVIQTIEVKTCVRKRDVATMIDNARTIKEMNTEVFPKNVCGTVATSAIAYTSGASFTRLQGHFFEYDSDNYNHLDLTILRLKGRGERAEVGAFLRRAETPRDDSDPEDAEWPGRWEPEFGKTLAPLSDFYYDLVRRGYDTLNSRAFSLRDISEHMMYYMEWGTSAE